MDKPRTIEKQVQRFFIEYCKENFFYYFFYTQSKFNCPRIVKKTEILLSDSYVTY